MDEKTGSLNLRKNVLTSSKIWIEMASRDQNWKFKKKWLLLSSIERIEL